MKKLTALLLVLALVLAMTACVREGPVETQPTQPPLPPGGTAQNQLYTEPDPDAREVTVSVLNHDPGTDAIWRELAREYTEATGVQVIAMTTASGVYKDVLPGQLSGRTPVTLFFAADPEDIPGTCADLSGSAAYEAMGAQELALTVDGKAVGLPFHAGSFGLLVNTGLLEKAGFTTEDLLTLEGLDKVVFSVRNRNILLGFQAFAAPALGTPEVAEILFTAAEGNADLVRPLWDLAVTGFGGDPAELKERTGASAFEDFLNGKALLCLASDGDLELPEDAKLLPLPTADGGVVGYGIDGWWCVNGDAPAADIEATVAFLDWVLTEKADAFGGELPYGEGSVYPITLQARALDARRVYPEYPDASQLAHVTEALAAYAADPSDGNWDRVRDVFRK